MPSLPKIGEASCAVGEFEIIRQDKSKHHRCADGGGGVACEIAKIFGRQMRWCFPHAKLVLGLMAGLYPISTIGAMSVSAINTFENNPMMMSVMPQLSCCASARFGSLSCSRNSLARTMGPATSWGKKVTYNA